MVCKGDGRAGRPVGGQLGRAALRGQRRPAPQVLEDAAHDLGIVDERHDPHRPLALDADERIGFVDPADELRLGGPGARGGLFRGHRRVWAWRAFRRSFLRPFAARPVGVPAHVANEVLVAVRDVAAEQLQPLGPGHELEVALQTRVHLGDAALQLDALSERHAFTFGLQAYMAAHQAVAEALVAIPHVSAAVAYRGIGNDMTVPVIA